MSLGREYLAEHKYEMEKAIERMEKRMNDNTITTNEVRLSFVHVFKPYAATPGAEERYSVTMLIPKADTDTMGRIERAIEAAKARGLTDKWNNVMPPQVPTPIWDGDGVRQDGTPFGDECKGCWVLTAGAKADRVPGIFDTALNPIIDQSEVYSGAYGRVNISFFAYNAAGKKGIGCGLNMLQKTRDGEPLAQARPSAAEAFGAPQAPRAASPGAGQGYVPMGSGQGFMPNTASGNRINPVTGLPF